MGAVLGEFWVFEHWCGRGDELRAAVEDSAVVDPYGEQLLESNLLRVGGSQARMLSGWWVESVEFGDYEAGVVIDVTADCHYGDAAVVNAQEVQIWTRKNYRLDLLTERSQQELLDA